MAQSDNKRTLINPPGTEVIYENWHFSQGVRVGDTVWTAGQVGVDENLQPGDGIEAQARLAFQNLERVLAEAGGSLADVVEMTSFHTSLADMPGFSQVKSEFVPKDYPAWTAVGVTELVLPELLVEIKAVAVIGSGSA